MSTFRERLNLFPSWLPPLALLTGLATGVLHFLWVYVWDDFWSLPLWEAIFWSVFAAWIIGGGSIGAYTIGIVLENAFESAVEEKRERRSRDEEAT